MQPNTVIPTIVHSPPSLLLFAHRMERILHVLSTAVMSSTPCTPCDLMMPSDKFDAKAHRSNTNASTYGLMPINDIDYHLFEQGLSKDLSKPALFVKTPYRLFKSLVWLVLPSQARSTEGRANVKQATQGPRHEPLRHSRLRSSSIPDDDEYDPVKQRVHTDELEPPAHVESSPTAVTTSSTRSMHTRDAGVCSCLTQGACARVCSTCHSGSPGH